MKKLDVKKIETEKIKISKNTPRFDAPIVGKGNNTVNINNKNTVNINNRNTVSANKADKNEKDSSKVQVCPKTAPKVNEKAEQGKSVVPELSKDTASAEKKEGISKISFKFNDVKAVFEKIGKEKKQKNKQTKKLEKAAKKDKKKKQKSSENMALVKKEESSAVVLSEEGKKTSRGGKLVNFFAFEDDAKVVTVKSGEKRSTGVGQFIANVATTALLAILLLFVVTNYVQIFENQSMINDLKQELEASRVEERRLNAELEQKYDLAQIGDYASSELGMVGSENNKKVYIDVGKEDELEIYEPETEDFGTIATIMNALGDTVKTWLDVFGK